jgi:hypothetical protein
MLGDWLSIVKEITSPFAVSERLVRNVQKTFLSYAFGDRCREKIDFARSCYHLRNRCLDCGYLAALISIEIDRGCRVVVCASFGDGGVGIKRRCNQGAVSNAVILAETSPLREALWPLIGMEFSYDARSRTNTRGMVVYQRGFDAGA